MHVQSCCFTNLNLLLFLPFSLPSPSSLPKLPFNFHAVAGGHKNRWKWTKSLPRTVFETGQKPSSTAWRSQPSIKNLLHFFFRFSHIRFWDWNKFFTIIVCHYLCINRIRIYLINVAFNEEWRRLTSSVGVCFVCQALNTYMSAITIYRAVERIWSFTFIVFNLCLRFWLKQKTFRTKPRNFFLNYCFLPHYSRLLLQLILVLE